MTSFSEWLSVKEDVAPDSNIHLKGRLGQQTGGINTLNRRMAQPLGRMTDKNRVTYMANMVAAVYNQVPPEQRVQQFVRDFTFLRPKILQAIRQSATQTQTVPQEQP